MLFRNIRQWNLHERQFKILYELITTTEKYVTGKKLSMVTALSLKTVKKEVELLNDQLIALDAVIVSSPGEGYRLISSNSLEYLDFEENVLEFYNRGLFFQDEKDNRVHYIIRRLFVAKEMVFIDDLAHECHVSRSVISKDIRSAKEELWKFKLQIINRTNQGLVIRGNEFNKRLCLLHEHKIMVNYVGVSQNRFDELFLEMFWIPEHRYQKLDQMVMMTFQDSSVKIPRNCYKKVMLMIILNINRDEIIDNRLFEGIFNELVNSDCFNKVVELSNQLKTIRTH